MPANPQQTVSPSRVAAFDILLRVEREDAYASELLHSTMLDKLSVQDRGLTMELVMGVLRWRSRLDAAIAQYSFTPFPRLDFEVLTALRIGAYQLEFLDRIPNRAAVNESVMLVKRAKKKSAAALTNVILRKIASSVTQRRRAITELDPAKAADPMRSTGPLLNRALAGESAPQFLARQYAHPEWLVERWIREYGVQTAAQICAYDQQVPRTTIRVRAEQLPHPLLSLPGTLPSQRLSWGRPARTPEPSSNSESGEVCLAPGKLLRSARVVESGDVTQTDACRRGELVIQDEGSQLIAALVGRVPLVRNPDGRNGSNARPRIVDCCAAPGGKSSAIADRNPDATIVAVDLHAHRARLMRELVRQTNVHIVTADATALPFVDTFDRVLADVPCSGTGTLARNPEIKWRLKPADVANLQQRQIAILNAALDRLAAGGRAVYSTCSLEHEENEDVVDAALSGRDDIRIIPIIDVLEQLAAENELACSDLESLTRGPYLRTVPGLHPCDGFFAAVLEKP